LKGGTKNNGRKKKKRDKKEIRSVIVSSHGQNAQEDFRVYCRERGVRKKKGKTGRESAQSVRPSSGEFAKLTR